MNEDEWVCLVDDKGMFTVNYVYRCLNYNLSSPSSIDCERLKLLGWVWESLAPSKVIVFSWQMLLLRLLTKVSLLRRGRGVCALGIVARCSWFLSDKETKDQLFVKFVFENKVWVVVSQSIGMSLVMTGYFPIVGKFLF